MSFCLFSPFFIQIKCEISLFTSLVFLQSVSLSPTAKSRSWVLITSQPILINSKLVPHTPVSPTPASRLAVPFSPSPSQNSVAVSPSIAFTASQSVPTTSFPLSSSFLQQSFEHLHSFNLHNRVRWTFYSHLNSREIKDLDQGHLVRKEQN